MINVVTSGDSPIETTNDDWTDVLEVDGRTIVGVITLINEGDWPGFWRLVQGDNETAPARLPCGGGATGERRAGVNIPCPGFSGGKLQVKRGLLGGHLTGVWAFGLK